MPLALKRSYYRGNSLWSHRFCCFVRGCAGIGRTLAGVKCFSLPAYWKQHSFTTAAENSNLHPPTLPPLQKIEILLML